MLTKQWLDTCIYKEITPKRILPAIHLAWGEVNERPLQKLKTKMRNVASKTERGSRSESPLCRLWLSGFSYEESLGIVSVGYDVVDVGDVEDVIY